MSGKFKITRQQAIKIIDQATDRGGYDDWWMDMMERLGLYDKKSDTAPTLKDVFLALGVSEEEIKNLSLVTPDKVSVSALCGTDLDYWTARAVGWLETDLEFLDGRWWIINKEYCTALDEPPVKVSGQEYSPTSNHHQCGELIKEFKIELYWGSEGKVCTAQADQHMGSDVDFRTAVCRARVISVFGFEVPAEMPNHE